MSIPILWLTGPMLNDHKPVKTDHHPTSCPACGHYAAFRDLRTDRKPVCAFGTMPCARTGVAEVRDPAGLVGGPPRAA